MFKILNIEETVLTVLFLVNFGMNVTLHQSEFFLTKYSCDCDDHHFGIHNKMKNTYTGSTSSEHRPRLRARHITLQALSFVEKAQPVRICFTLHLRDHRST